MAQFAIIVNSLESIWQDDRWWKLIMQLTHFQHIEAVSDWHWINFQFRLNLLRQTELWSSLCINNRFEISSNQGLQLLFWSFCLRASQWEGNFLCQLLFLENFRANKSSQEDFWKTTSTTRCVRLSSDQKEKWKCFVAGRRVFDSMYLATFPNYPQSRRWHQKINYNLAYFHPTSKHKRQLQIRIKSLCYTNKTSM